MHSPGARRAEPIPAAALDRGDDWLACHGRRAAGSGASPALQQGQGALGAACVCHGRLPSPCPMGIVHDAARRRLVSTSRAAPPRPRPREQRRRPQASLRGQQQRARWQQRQRGLPPSLRPPAPPPPPPPSPRLPPRPRPRLLPSRRRLPPRQQRAQQLQQPQRRLSLQQRRPPRPRVPRWLPPSRPPSRLQRSLPNRLFRSQLSRLPLLRPVQQQLLPSLPQHLARPQQWRPNPPHLLQRRRPNPPHPPQQRRPNPPHPPQQRRPNPPHPPQRRRPSRRPAALGLVRPLAALRAAPAAPAATAGSCTRRCRWMCGCWVLACLARARWPTA